MSEPWYSVGDVCVEIDGIAVHHRLPGPFTVERFKSGLACVLNANGINWVHVDGGTGQILFHPEIADVIAASLIATKSQPD